LKMCGDEKGVDEGMKLLYENSFLQR
jgi:hypothetical protein